jgi:hypothetical protein
MSRALLASLVVLAAGAAGAQTWPPPVWPLGRDAPHVPGTAAEGAAFQVVDALGHQDDFWLNSLVGDADHDGRQEIILRELPVGGGPTRIVFHEDDGTGQFSEVFSFPFGDGGLLAIGDVDKDGLTDLFLERALGFCQHEFVWRESLTPAGFPAQEVWTSPKEGNVVDFRGVIVDVDKDGLREFVTADANFTCIPSSLKLFEAGGPGDPPNTLNLVVDFTLGGDIGNPVVADFDLDGRLEIALVQASAGRILLFESVGDNLLVQTAQVQQPLFNAYQMVAITRASPDVRPMLFLAGQAGSADYRVRVYEALGPDSLSLVNSAQAPANCGASIPQIWAADVTGTRVPEILLDRLCDPVPIFQVGPGGALTLFDLPIVPESLEIVATTQTPGHSGAIAVGTFPTAGNPAGSTLVLEVP